MNKVSNLQENSRIRKYDEFLQNAPAVGAIEIKEERGSMETILNSYVDPAVAHTNRYNYVEQVLSRVGKPFEMSQIASNNNYQSLDDMTKSVIDDLFISFLDYKNGNTNTDALIRVESDATLANNPQGINYHVNYNGSGDNLKDALVLLKSFDNIVFAKTDMLNKPDDLTSIMSLLVYVKSSGNMLMYQTLLKLLNRSETYNYFVRHIPKIHKFVETYANSIGVNALATNNFTQPQRNYSIQTLMEMVTSMLYNILSVPLAGSYDQNMLYSILATLTEIMPMNDLELLNSFSTKPVNLTDAQKRKIDIAVATLKSGNNLNQNTLQYIIVIYTLLTVMEVMPTIQNTEISYTMEQFVSITLDTLGINIANNNVQLAMEDYIAIDLMAGVPLLCTMNDKPIELRRVAEKFFISNPMTMQPMLSPNNIVSFNAVNNKMGNIGNEQGITFMSVRNYILNDKSLKDLENNNVFNDIVNAILNVLAKL